MKRILLASVLCGVALLGVQGQGTVNFATFVGSTEFTDESYRGGPVFYRLIPIPKP